MENKIFKEYIHDVDYNPIIYVLNMLDLPGNIKQVKVETIKRGGELELEKSKGSP